MDWGLVSHLHDDSVEISATQEPRQADVGDVCAGEHDALETRTVEAHDGGDVVVALRKIKETLISVNKEDKRSYVHNSAL